MQKRIAYLMIPFAALIVVSCQKTDTYSEKSIASPIDGTVQTKLKGDAKDCRVQRIIESVCCGIKDTLLFHYNSWGDPDTVLRRPHAGTGSPNLIFRYDKKRRLTDILGLYESGGRGEFWHRYSYENPGNSNIVLDSIFVFVSTPTGTFPSFSALTFFRYDKEDRIIMDSTVDSRRLDARVNHYAYDKAGNQIGRTYDNQTNIQRTNKIFMFFDRDYSINNPFTASSYNASGLPTSFNFPSSDPHYLNFLTFFKNAEISYSCN
jgi:hypothetical protein